MAQDMLPDDQVQASITDQVSMQVKSSVIEIYEDLLRTIWAKIVPTLGTATVVTIVNRAVSRTTMKHPSLHDLAVSDTGFDFTAIKAQIGREDKRELKNGFKELVANLFDILVKLTGNILVQQLMKEVEGIEIP